MPPPKVKKQSAGTKFLREIQGYLKALAILAVAVVALVIFLQTRASTAEFKITVLVDPNESTGGTLVIRDASGSELAKKTVSESGARCPFYKRVDLNIRAKKTSEYVFEWNSAASDSLTDAELSSNGYALVLDTRKGAYATAGGPSQVC